MRWRRLRRRRCYDAATHKLRPCPPRHPRPASALITGLTGQDGSFLAELLLEQGYDVTGLVRGAPDRSLGCSEHLREQVEPGARRPARSGLPARGDRAEPARRDLPPRRPVVRARLVGAPGRDVERDRRLDRDACSRSCARSAPSTRVFVAASGAMFGEAPQSPQREDTPCRPTDALRDREARRPPSWWGRCASTTGCTRARGSSSTTSPSAAPSGS